MAAIKKLIKDPMKYKTGKPRLGPLNAAQLAVLLVATSKPKLRAKILHRISIVAARTPVSEDVVEPVLEASV
jgi:hypothetical protein